jgi:hypothetical protein
VEDEEAAYPGVFGWLKSGQIPAIDLLILNNNNYLAIVQGGLSRTGIKRLIKLLAQ